MNCLLCLVKNTTERKQINLTLGKMLALQLPTVYYCSNIDQIF
jgi:hypothetical protein